MTGRSIAWKLCVLILATYGTAFALSSLVWEVSRSRVMREGRRYSGMPYTRVVVHLMEKALPKPLPDDAALTRSLERLFEELPDVSVTLFDTRGRTRARLRPKGDTFIEPEALAEAVGRSPLETMVETTNSYWPTTCVRRVGDFEPPIYAAVTTAPPATGKGRDSAWMQLLRWQMPAMFAVASIVAGILASRLFLRRLRAFEQGVAALSKGDLAARIDPGPDDEMGRLGQAFNAMAANLAEQDRARRELLADVAHELRTPLTSMMCQVQLLQEQAQEQGGAFREQLDIIVEDGMALGRRIKELLIVAREEAGIRLKVEKSDLKELLRQVARHFESLCRKRSIALKLELEGPAMELEMDRDRMGQVFENLLQNALQCLGEGGTIAIRARREGGEAIVEVEDDGPGIPAAELPTLFERFQRGEGNRGSGTGLGLAIVKRFVERHAGRCEVASELGKGSRFTVRLPARKSGPPA